MLYFWKQYVRDAIRVDNLLVFSTDVRIDRSGLLTFTLKTYYALDDLNMEWYLYLENVCDQFNHANTTILISLNNRY